MGSPKRNQGGKGQLQCPSGNIKTWGLFVCLFRKGVGGEEGCLKVRRGYGESKQKGTRDNF